MDSTIQWKAYINSLLMKFSAAYYAWRTLKPIMSQVLVMVYISYFHSIMSYLQHNFFGVLHHIFRIKKNI
jgi:hypothetical protein